MRYKLFNLFLGTLFVSGFVFVSVAYGAVQDNGGGIYYDTVTGRYCTSSSGCSMDNPTDIDQARALRQAAISAEFDRNYAAAGGKPILPTGVAPANQCIAGTMTGTLANGTAQCQAFINGQMQTINYCTGNETTGPCKPQNIDAIAAANAALAESLKTGKSCVAERVSFPGVDPQTGLNYYYFINCGGDSSGNGSGGSTGARTNYSGSGSTLQTSSASSQLSTLTNTYLSIMRSFINISRAATSQISTQNPTGAVIPTAVTQGTTQSTTATQGTTPGGTTTSAGTKTSKFSYTFTKVGNSWKVTLDNAALGVPTDHFYIPTNYSIIAANAQDLNIQSQGRFNNMDYFPGTPAGNTFYSEMFGAFIRAYYDWDKQTNTTSASAPSTPNVPGVATPSTISFPATITVTIPILNIRTEPNTQSRTINSFQKGATFTAGNIVDGESIDGNNKWWVIAYGTGLGYVWSGGTAQSPIAMSSEMKFPVTVTIISTLPLNVRSSPNMQASVVTQYNNGATFLAGNLKDGEVVEGNGKWWETVIGSMPAYIWSGGAAIVY